ncbi:ABC transporter substrate-binding protein [Paracraurococcus lichenis]|uniref:ABC transporter substrate-binding protein n=1 Tax=Paracraurococcus lichenis TaxID=3064888 RepID=A0ABT9E8R0_9PROT|nr:ABC transporter substrate-binding protein [Paracraurococcus sp. LOR1-02]MDO9712592.1 ABC transporter substrate-binding protein [Paracraurococcus sp. LOR1-02]
MLIGRRTGLQGLAGAAAAAVMPRDAEAQSRAETLRQITGNTINTLDLTMPGATRESFGIGMQLYDRLVAFGRKPVPGGHIFDHTNIRGELAESYSVSPDGTRFRFRLRRDAKWHDGSPVTAEDVKWSLDRHVSANSLAKSQLQISNWVSPEQFRVLDPMTVEAVLAKPDRRGLMNLAVPYVIMINSRLARQHATAADPWAQQWMKENTAGGGAYTVEAFKPGEQLVLRRSEAWRNGPERKLPFFRRIIAQTVPEAATRASLLERGDADLSIDLLASDVPALQQRGRVKVFSTPIANGFTHIAFNTRMAPFDNVKVRQAIGAAMPYEDMFQASIFGRGARLYGGEWSELPPDASFPRPMPQHTDLARAKQLLTEAGFPDGFRTTFSFSAGLAAAMEPLAALLKEALARIGIQVELQKMPDAQFNTAQAEKRLPMFVDGATAWLPETDYYLRLYFTRDQRWNFSNYNNPEINTLTEAAQFERDPVKYEAMCRRMVGILAQEVPELFLWQPNFDAVMARTIEDFTYQYHRQVDFRDLSRA